MMFYIHRGHTDYWGHPLFHTAPELWHRCMKGFKIKVVLQKEWSLVKKAF